MNTLLLLPHLKNSCIRKKEWVEQTQPDWPAGNYAAITPNACMQNRLTRQIKIMSKTPPGNDKNRFPENLLQVHTPPL
jgi:hypothetical protein